jgi:hypothetical protein
VNPLWGAPRIRGELRMLGVDVSERTVSRLLEPHIRPPSQTWRTFLTNHLASAASMELLRCRRSGIDSAGASAQLVYLSNRGSIAWSPVCTVTRRLASW